MREVVLSVASQHAKSTKDFKMEESHLERGVTSIAPITHSKKFPVLQHYRSITSSGSYQVLKLTRPMACMRTALTYRVVVETT